MATNASQRKAVSDEQTSLSTHAQHATARAEKHELPRDDECDVCDGEGHYDGVECFACIDFEQLTAEVEAVTVDVPEELDL